MQIRAQSILKLSNIYFAAAFAVAVSAIAYGIIQFGVFTAEKQAALDNEATRAMLALELTDAQKTFQPFAEERAKAQADFSKKIAVILPPNESYTELTRQLDDYFASHDVPGNKIFQSSLRFGKGAPVEGMPTVSVLPFSMNIDSTRDNFFKFLEFVNNSGSLDSDVRLMEVNSIQLNFAEGGEVIKDTKQELNFTVDMNAYFQTPK